MSLQTYSISSSRELDVTGIGFIVIINIIDTIILIDLLELFLNVTKVNFIDTRDKLDVRYHILMESE